jgi:tetratricopeptide (TPR) repeat protein
MQNHSTAICALIIAIAAGLAVPSATADYKQAVVLYNRGQYDKAIQELKPDLDDSPEWEAGHRLLGLCYLNLKNNALAVSAFTRAVQLKSTAIATYIGLGRAFFNMQKYDNCIQALNQGEPLLANLKTDVERQRYDLYHLRGSAYLAAMKPQDAANDLTSALRTGLSDWSDYSELGDAYYRLGRLDEAIMALQKALSIKPGQSAVTDLLGNIFFKKGVQALQAKQYPQALDALQKARDYDPKNGYVFYNLAETYLFQKNYVEAEKALNEALALLPRSQEALQRLGFVYEKEKKWDQSLAAYKKANEINPSPALKEAMDRVLEAKKH